MIFIALRGPRDENFRLFGWHFDGVFQTDEPRLGLGRLERSPGIVHRVKAAKAKASESAWLVSLKAHPQNAI